MKKKTPFLLVAFMFLALIGLMIIQVYWIRDALIVKQTGFKRDIHEMMNRVRTRLDEMELSKNYLRHYRQLNQDQKLMREMDSIYLDFMEQISGIKALDEVGTLSRLLALSEPVRGSSFFDSQYIPVEQRLNINVLDSIISEELNRKGIHTPYEFGVYSSLRDKMVFQKTGQYPNKLLSKLSFKTPIYAYFNYPYADQLLVYFPNEQRYVFLKVWGMLSVSIVLVLIIIGSFLSSIKTIFRQKKIEVMKNDFINNMTHELKTPISTISLACQAFNDDDMQMSPELSSTYISMISDENKRLQKMVEKVLQTAIIEKGQLKLNFEPIDIHEILKEAEKHFALQIKEKSGSLSLKLEATHIKGNADRLHLTNSFFNIIDNAMKYTINSPEIVITTRDFQNGIVVEFKDNGIGISKSNQKKIFEKLYRVHTGNIHNFKGFGLGLSYVKAIIELHNGSISLESEPKKGSIFRIYLPFNQQKFEQ
ncbi:MAG: sensor histidine kinase [Bacteroidales bacterium]